METQLTKGKLFFSVYNRIFYEIIKVKRNESKRNKKAEKELAAIHFTVQCNKWLHKRETQNVKLIPRLSLLLTPSSPAGKLIKDPRK
jgi:hypothetical protein